VGAPIGLSLVFFNVLLDQLGLPVPAYPTLILAGAMAASGRLPGSALVALAVLACLIGDGAWYFAGRLYGGRVMKLVCIISLTPDVCVGQAQTNFERWGPKLIIVAKFLPGVALVVPPLAGALRMNARHFVAFSTLSALLWVGAPLLGGMLFKDEIERALPHLTDFGGTLAAVFLALLPLYIAYKWWQRRRYYSALDMARISVAELCEKLLGSPAPLVLDVRTLTAEALEARRIPGALHLPLQELPRRLKELPRDREIILYCSCPHEASAAQAALLLMNNGFKRVRPLSGGIDAWITAGYTIEDIPASAFNGAQSPPAAHATRRA